MPAGRPTDYNIEIAKEICDTVASTGSGLRTLCNKFEHWPHVDSIYAWLRKYREFSELYEQAKRDQVRALVDEILEISDDSSHDEIINDKGNVTFNAEYAARSRLRVDTRKWIACKLVPRLYGDNALARELADEMEEFKKTLDAKKLKDSKHGKVNSRKKK